MNSSSQLERDASRLHTRGQLIFRIVLVRLMLMLSMAISCALIPDHNPGDDVLRFHLRLDFPVDCFCITEHHCARLANTEVDSTGCALPQSTTSPKTVQVWQFLLSPFTKWDAARFLNLAARPDMRDPPIACQEGDGQKCDFSESEQAHAFFPLFPMLIRNLSEFLMKVVPSPFLPPTFECLLVLAGLIVNLGCNVVAVISLHSLTSFIIPRDIEEESRRRVANAVCLVYGVWNPAAVFFATNYSESLFSALTLMGHWAFSKRYLLVAFSCWMFASYARSNGSIHSLWLLLTVIGQLCYHAVAWGSGKSSFSASNLWRLALLCVGAASVLLPIRYHDVMGFLKHCNNDVKIRPEWCQNDSKSFSFYAWTQQRHWNVGLFKYYRLSQIPNFLLAAPILFLSMFGVIWWIRTSMTRFGKGKMPGSLYLMFVGWPMNALSNSVALIEDTSLVQTGNYPCDYLVENPMLLAHYALLAGLVLVGLLVAHIQISTRMICSSTPAIVWFLTYCHLQKRSILLRKFVTAYTVLFLLLGIILHPNFLPWT